MVTKFYWAMLDETVIADRNKRAIVGVLGMQVIVAPLSKVNSEGVKLKY